MDEQRNNTPDQRLVDIWKGFAEPFQKQEIRSRQQGGRSLSYITARAVQNRLDEVVGGWNWTATYRDMDVAQSGNVVRRCAECTLTVVLPDGRAVVRVDVGGASNPDPLVALKGARSDALKRAAVGLGIGRHLYGDGIPEYDEGEIDHDPAPSPRPSSPARQDDRPGEKLLRWLAAEGERTGRDVVRGASQWGRRNGLGDDIRGWPAEACVDCEAFVRSQLGKPSPAAPRREEFADWLNNQAASSGIEAYQLLNHLMKWASGPKAKILRVADPMGLANKEKWRLLGDRWDNHASEFEAELAGYIQAKAQAPQQ